MPDSPQAKARPPNTPKVRRPMARGPDGRFLKRVALAPAPARAAPVAAPAPAKAPVPAPIVSLRRAAPAPAPVLAPAPRARHAGLRVALFATVLLVAASAAFATLTASQNGNGNSGTIKVHDGASADPPTRNEPHVEGDVWVEGFNMAATEGTLEIFSWPPTGNKELVSSTTWEADDGEPANHFLEGPFVLPCGHYRVEAQNGLEEDDFPGGKKSKMFWVECPPAEPPCGEPGGEPCPEEPPCGEPGGEPCPCGEPGGEPCPPCGEPGQEPCPVPCGEPGGEPCPEEPPCGEPGGEPCPVPEMVCPTQLLAVAREDGSVRLTWTDAAGSDGTNVYRADGDGDFVYLATVDAGVGEYVDATTVPGEAYTYTVTGLYGESESTDCAEVEVTAIPEFPTVVALGAASGAGLLALVLARRRKA